jgi:plasmid stability protein
MAMSDLLIRKVPAHMKRQIEKRARANGRSMSEETQALIQKGLSTVEPDVKMGTFLSSLLEKKYRGDDLVFERNDLVSPPPNFE